MGELAVACETWTGNGTDEVLDYIEMCRGASARCAMYAGKVSPGTKIKPVTAASLTVHVSMPKYRANPAHTPPIFLFGPRYK